MAIKPILFNTEMVRAILDGRKTCTRRVIKPQWEECPTCKYVHNEYIYDKMAENVYCARCGYPMEPERRSPYQPGDILYVRETWGISNMDDESKMAYIVYRASEEQKNEGCREVHLPDEKFEKMYESMAESEPEWRPSIHMPKEAARIWLKVTNVRVERLQEITEDQTEEEGFLFTPPCLHMTGENYCDIDGPCTSEIKYCDMGAGELFGKVLWNSTIKKSDLDRYGWDANPWVFVIEFERCEKPQEV